MRARNNVSRGILLISIAFAAAILCGCASSRWNIDNPYADVDWNRHQRVKANFHTHTTQSDGSLSPAEAIGKYHELGYQALALTDHNKVTWPWEVYDSGAGRLGMVAVQGAEASRHHHIGALFCGVPGASSETGTLAQVRRQGGLAVMHHPGRYGWPAKRYVELFREWDQLAGMEVFNQGDRFPGDRKTWDEVLAVLMPEGRPVWGFSNDDMHRDAQLGRNWNVLLVPALSPQAVRRAVEQGAFFFVYAPKAREGTMPPSISAISVDSKKGIIRIKASGYERIEWISGGKIVHRGDTIDLAAKTNVNGYIRAVIHAAGGSSLTCTQPMRIRAGGTLP